MARHRTPSAHAAVSAVSPRPACPPPAALPAAAAGERHLKRAALYARVSTEKHARADTVASQVDLLYKAAAAYGYDIAPTSVFIDEGVSGTRLDRPALDRLRDLAAEGVFEVLLVTVPDRLARRYAQRSIIEILRDALYKGEAYDNRTQAGDVHQPYGRHGGKDRVPGNGQGRTRRPPSE